MLTPMEIHDHQFKKTFRGYSENEVDDFLDKIVVDFEKLMREIERLKNQVNTYNVELEKYRGLEKTMNDTLMVAQRTADEVISTARKNAEELKEQAARECQQIRDQAQFEAKQQIEKANKKREAILADYTKLVVDRNSFLLKMRTMLESELAITNHVIGILPKVDEVAETPVPEDKPVEKPKPPVEKPKPAEKSKPVEKSKPAERIPESIDDSGELNIIDAVSKPVETNDGTRTYKPVKPASKLDKGDVH